MTTASFNIPITDDNILENNENIQIEINVSSLPSRVGINNPSQATIIIVDNDSKLILLFYIRSYVCINGNLKRK